MAQEDKHTDTRRFAAFRTYSKRFDIAERVAYSTPWMTEREKMWMVLVLMESMEKMLGKPWMEARSYRSEDGTRDDE